MPVSEQWPTMNEIFQALVGLNTRVGSSETLHVGPNFNHEHVSEGNIAFTYHASRHLQSGAVSIFP